MTVVEIFRVEGMTCGHCVQAVTSEIGALPGVIDVRVDLPTGGVTVRSVGPVGFDAVAGAVDEAGYRTVPAQKISLG